MNELFYTIILFAFGVAVGSFSNVLIFRYDPDHNVFARKRISGRSHCPKCKKQLNWYELIPVLSFVIQGARCRGCHASISWQYPIVELLGGALFAGIPLFLNSFYGISSQLFFSLSLPYWYYFLLIAWILVFWVLLLITAIDFKFFIIPNELNLFLMILGVAITFFLSQDAHGLLMPFRTAFVGQYAMLFTPFSSVIWNHIAGAVLGFLFFLMLNVVTRGRGIGFGDVKLSFVIGLIFGWPDIALIAMLSFIIGGLWSVALVLLRAKKMRDKVPFAPFFVVGTLLTFFFGILIIKGYFGVFGL